MCVCCLMHMFVFECVRYDLCVCVCSLMHMFVCECVCVI